MLVIGNYEERTGSNCLTTVEEQSQFAIWCISASPLIMGNGMSSRNHLPPPCLPVFLPDLLPVFLFTKFTKNQLNHLRLMEWSVRRSEKRLRIFQGHPAEQRSYRNLSGGCTCGKLNLIKPV